MMAWWYRPKHVVTLDKINIYNTSCVLTCVNLYSLFVYIEHNGDESPKEHNGCCALQLQWLYLSLIGILA